MMLSSAACIKSTETDSYLSAQADKTYTGTVIELNLEHIVISAGEGNIRIPYTEDTQISGFGGMDGMRQPGGMSSKDEMQQSGGINGMDEMQQPGGMPPEDAEGDTASQNTESKAAPEPPENEMKNHSSDSTGAGIEEISLKDEVTVVVGDDGTASSITKDNDAASGDPGGSGNPTGNMSAPENYDSANEYTDDIQVSDASLTSTGKDENAVLVETEGITASLDHVTISRRSDESTGGDSSSFYGVGAAALVTDGILSISDSEISTDASGSAGVFSYGNGTAYVSDSTITTTQDTSGGIHVAGGGTLYAQNLTVETNGESSAAIRSDRGSGTMLVDGGSYTSNGVGSPAVYSTADITIHNADLKAFGSEASCIEGHNTIRLFDCDLTGNMRDLEQNDCTWNVILYQSMSGDSEAGNSTFEMIGGSLTANNGGMFYTTNTESTFLISDVEIKNAENSEFLLKCTGNSNQRGWGSKGSNGADCHFTAIDQVLEGNVIWDSISNLDFYLTTGSTLTGSWLQDETNAGNGGDGYAKLYIDQSSTWIVTGNSVLTSLSSSGTIVDAEGNSVSVIGTDGTVYQEGTSAFTVTVESYSSEADISGASSPDSWDQYQMS